jgi:hypothetical protein
MVSFLYSLHPIYYILLVPSLSIVDQLIPTIELIQIELFAAKYLLYICICRVEANILRYMTWLRERIRQCISQIPNVYSYMLYHIDQKFLYCIAY